MEPFHTRSAKLLDAIINHPSIRPTAQLGEERLHSGDLLEDESNHCYATDGGAALFISQGRGVYEGHIFCLEGSRGSAALALGRGALKAMFARPGTLKIVAAVPMQLPAARLLCRHLGFASLGPDADAVNELFTMEARR